MGGGGPPSVLSFVAKITLTDVYAFTGAGVNATCPTTLATPLLTLTGIGASGTDCNV